MQRVSVWRRHSPTWRGRAPEVYRDALTDFVVRNNPKK
jgi:hypothetical protein